MYMTILVLTMFIYFVFKDIRTIWNEAPKRGRRSLLRQMYLANSSGASGPHFERVRTCASDVGRGVNAALQLASTSNSGSESAPLRRCTPPRRPSLTRERQKLEIPLATQPPCTL
uniref:Secreted protein n=1 Tax=Mesocestoides corti TaxID=53468 RepID=A0A5K3EYG6_MESCO